MNKKILLSFFLTISLQSLCPAVLKEPTPSQQLLWLAASYELPQRHRFPLSKTIKETVICLLKKGAKPRDKDVIATIYYNKPKGSHFECECVLGPAFEGYKARKLGELPERKSSKLTDEDKESGLKISKAVDEAIKEWEML